MPTLRDVTVENPRLKEVELGYSTVFRRPKRLIVYKGLFKSMVSSFRVYVRENNLNLDIYGSLSLYQDLEKYIVRTCKLVMGVIPSSVLYERLELERRDLFTWRVPRW